MTTNPASASRPAHTASAPCLGKQCLIPHFLASERGEGLKQQPDGQDDEEATVENPFFKVQRGTIHRIGSFFVVMSCLVLYQVIAREPNYILWRDAKMTIFPHAISGCAGGDELERNEWVLKCRFHGLNRCFPSLMRAKSRLPAPASNRNRIPFVPNVKRSLIRFEL